MARQLTIESLNRMINEEKAKANIGAGKSTSKAAKETEEVDACGYADTIAKPVNYMKALKIEQARLKRQLQRVNEAISKASRLTEATVTKSAEQRWVYSGPPKRQHFEKRQGALTCAERNAPKGKDPESYVFKQVKNEDGDWVRA